MNISSLDLNLLRVLDALLQEGSTVRAGEKIGLSQPAVSSALGRLRQALNDPLFVRRGQGLVPTDFAMRLKDPLRVQLDNLQNILGGSDEFDPAVATNRFRVSGSDYFAELLMPELAARVSQSAPNLRISLVDMVNETNISALDREKIDLAILPRIRVPDWVASAPAFRSDFRVIARREHPGLVRAGVAPDDVFPLDLFCQCGHVLFSPLGNLNGQGDDSLARIGRRRNVVMSMPVFSGIARAVSESDLIALLPRQFAIRSSDRMGLGVYRLPFPMPKLPLVMIWPRRLTDSAAHSWLRTQVAEIVAPFDDGPD